MRTDIKQKLIAKLRLLYTEADLQFLINQIQWREVETKKPNSSMARLYTQFGGNPIHDSYDTFVHNYERMLQQHANDRMNGVLQPVPLLEDKHVLLNVGDKVILDNWWGVYDVVTYIGCFAIQGNFSFGDCTIQMPVFDCNGIKVDGTMLKWTQKDQYLRETLERYQCTKHALIRR